MRWRVSLLILVGWASLTAVQAATPQPVPKASSQCNCEVTKAPIEEVLHAVDDGYRFDAYIVRWHGARALVTAPFADGHLQVGDELTFRVMKLEAAGQNSLTFISLDGSGNPEVPRALGRTLYSEQRPPIGMGGEQTVVPIQEVLQVEDGRYQQTAYIGQWHGTTVAIACILACSAYNAGEPLPVMTVRLSVGGIKSLGFQVMPQAQQLAAAGMSPPPVQRQLSQDSGFIEEVINGKLDGVAYTAYIVQWKGAHIALSQQSQTAIHHVGESLLLQVVRWKIPPPIGGGTLDFSMDRPVEAVDPSAAMNASMSTVTGVVDSVLSAQDDIYRYRAYIVSFHGARVIVQDILGSTHYNAGDSISFAETRTGTAGARFMLMDLAGLMKQATDESAAH